MLNCRIKTLLLVQCFITLVVAGAEKVNVGWITEINGNQVKVKVTKASYMKDTFTFDEKTKMFFPGFNGIGQIPKGPQVGCGIKYRIDKNGRATVLTMEPPLKPSMYISDMYERKIKELFEIGDENKDSRIDIVEYSTYFRAGKRSPKHFPGVFASQYDQDKNGSLNFEEFKTVITNSAGYQQKQKTPEEWMKLADKNGDGEISVDEFVKNIPGVGHTEKVVPRNDKDKSGGLSLAELTAWLNNSIE